MDKHKVIIDYDDTTIIQKINNRQYDGWDDLDYLERIVFDEKNGLYGVEIFFDWYGLYTYWAKTVKSALRWWDKLLSTKIDGETGMTLDSYWRMHNKILPDDPNIVIEWIKKMGKNNG